MTPAQFLYEVAGVSADDFREFELIAAMNGCGEELQCVRVVKRESVEKNTNHKKNFHLNLDEWTQKAELLKPAELTHHSEAQTQKHPSTKDLPIHCGLGSR